jgi:hypothetical protein
MSPRPNVPRESRCWCCRFDVKNGISAHLYLSGLHRRWFKIAMETFDAIHYTGLAIYKIGILLLNLVPLRALYLTS